ncbi:transposase for transposon domain protein [Escherichia coli 2-011-08_S1_C3]|nr:transposase for transposon domain protein [Escherichia coli 2-011-08_S1_C3]
MSSRDLAKFTDVRCYASLVCVISEAKATQTDEVIELHERILGSLFSRAKRTQAERLQQTGKLKQYVTVGQALLNARESGEDPWAAIEDVLPWQEFVNNVDETRFLSRKDNHLITEKTVRCVNTPPEYCPRCSSWLRPPQCSSVTRWIPSERCIENSSEKSRYRHRPGSSRIA